MSEAAQTIYRQFLSLRPSDQKIFLDLAKQTDAVRLSKSQSKKIVEAENSVDVDWNKAKKLIYS